MAKSSAVNKNMRRVYLVGRDDAKRRLLSKIAKNRSLAVEERFEATLRLAQMSRNGSRVRVRLRCALTGRPRGNYRKFKVCRIALRDLANNGQIPGLVKASW